MEAEQRAGSELDEGGHPLLKLPFNPGRICPWSFEVLPVVKLPIPKVGNLFEKPMGVCYLVRMETYELGVWRGRDIAPVRIKMRQH